MGSWRQQRTDGGRRAGAADRRLLLALAAMLALVWQSFVLQTHVHLPTFPVAQQTEAHSAGAPDDAADCPICLESAQSGNYLTPDAFDLPRPLAIVAASPIARIALWAGRHAPPGWTSRGPPPFLQDR